VSPKRFDLLVIGEINPDLILRGNDPVPEFGQVEKLVDTATLTVGSSSAIAACAAARLGLHTAFAGLVGNDTFGRFMIDELAARGIDISGCVVDEHAATGVSVILEDPARDAGRAILTAPGAMAQLRADLVSHKLIAAARHVHCGGFFLQPALHPGLPALFERAGRAGATRSLDMNWDPAGHWTAITPDLLAECDLLLPNAAEAVRLTGADCVEDAIERLGRDGTTVAVKLGADGAVMRAAGTTLRASPPPVHAVDAIGAGDCFDAGLILGFIEGCEPERQLALAVACGAISTRAVGGIAGQPTREEAERVADGLTVTATARSGA
jgi:sugar/nucleoside kinase (ribokinase family)